MKTQTTFSEIVDLVRQSNINELKKRMFRANRLAKRTTGGARERLYEAKHQALSQLLTIGAAQVNSFVTWPEPLLGLDLEGGGRIHIKPAGLTLKALEVVVHQVEERIRNEILAPIG